MVALNVSHVKAQINSIESLIHEHHEAGDYFGVIQLKNRLKRLEKSIENHKPVAGKVVALTFRGPPIHGNTGINADFAGKVISKLSALVDATAHARNGPIGSRGPLKQRDDRKVVIKGTATGSFGFVFEEEIVGEQGQFDLEESALNEALKLMNSASMNEKNIEDIEMESMEDRVLSTLKDWFKLLSDNMVDLNSNSLDNNFYITKEMNINAYNKLDSISLDSEKKTITGNLYFIPKSKKFEMHNETNVIKGTISSSAMSDIILEEGSINNELSGAICEADIVVRQKKNPWGGSSFLYRLIGIRRVDR